MNLLRSPLEQQVFPAPWLVARDKVDVPSLIAKALARAPNASVDEVVEQLRAWGTQVSGISVARWMMRRTASSS